MCDDDIGENFCIGLLYVRTYSGGIAGKYNAYNAPEEFKKISYDRGFII